MPQVGIHDERSFSKPPGGSEILSAQELAQAAAPTAKETIEQAAQTLGASVSQMTAPLPTAREVSDEERQMFLRTLLAKERFTKSYTLFGDYCTVVFQTRTVKENTLSQKRLHKMVWSIVSLKFKGGQTIAGLSLIKQENGEFVQYETDVFESMNEVFYSALVQQFNDFEELCDVLFQKANQPDFWMRTDGDTSRSVPSAKA